MNMICFRCGYHFETDTEEEGITRIVADGGRVEKGDELTIWCPCQTKALIQKVGG